MSEAHISRIPRDKAGNVGMIEALGSRATVEEAQGYAETIGRLYHPNGSLHWKQFSATTWGLMNGQVYTNILVSWLDN